LPNDAGVREAAATRSAHPTPWQGATFDRAADAGAYRRVARVDGAGIVRGVVRHRGPRPVLADETIRRDVEVCGKTKPSARLEIDREGGVRGAIVSLLDLQYGKDIDISKVTRLEQRGCAFVPHVSVAPLGGQLELVSHDDVLHSPHAFLDARTLFHQGLTDKGQAIPKRLLQAGLTEVRCDAGHPWESAYVLIAENPYHAVTRADGSFELRDVPPGEHRVRLWHEGWRVVDVLPDGRKDYGAPIVRVRRVVVPRGGVARLEFELASE
jgi:hypothetical protein